MRPIGDMYPKVSPTYSRVFTLEVDGHPIVAFEASRSSEAQQLCKEKWLLDDLAILKSGGAPLRAAQPKLSVRPATSEEITAFEQAAPEPTDEMVLVFWSNLTVERADLIARKFVPRRAPPDFLGNKRPPH